MSRMSWHSQGADDNRVLLVVGGVFSVIGAVALAICGFFIVTGWQAASAQTGLTTGTITVVRPVDSYDRHDDTCTLRYHYEVDGRSYDSGTRTSDTWACSRYEGEAVEVRYDPQRPWQGSILTDQTGLWALTIAGTLGPLVFLTIGLVTLIAGIRLVRGAQRDSRLGEPGIAGTIEPGGLPSDSPPTPDASGWPLWEPPGSEQR